MKSLQKPNSESWKTVIQVTEFKTAVMKKLKDVQETQKGRAMSSGTKGVPY